VTGGDECNENSSAEKIAQSRVSLDSRVPCELSATPAISLYKNTTCFVSKTPARPVAATGSRITRTARTARTLRAGRTHSAFRVVDVRLHVHPPDVGMVRKVVCQTTIMRLQRVSYHNACSEILLSDEDA
jgi:hypothetical protein